ncbi:MAG: hypothetical protein P9L89_06715 [Candidatus Celaenobacter polaris]|nr:hypothetical protein [Candidatus Celaenobacter polaris]
MDSKGRAFNNIIAEQLCRIANYNELYLKEYLDYFSSRNSMIKYFEFYGTERRYMSIGNRIPFEICYKNRKHLKMFKSA